MHAVTQRGDALRALRELIALTEKLPQRCYDLSYYNEIYRASRILRDFGEEFAAALADAEKWRNHRCGPNLDEALNSGDGSYRP